LPEFCGVNLSHQKIKAMKKNLGSIDRSIRLLGAMLIGILYFTGQITGTTALILGIVGILLAGTALLAFCPVYPIFDLSTRKREKSSLKPQSEF
jgi:hypothetical protein